MQKELKSCKWVLELVVFPRSINLTVIVLIICLMTITLVFCLFFAGHKLINSVVAN